MLDDYPSVRPGPPKASSIIMPQVFSLPKGTERYVVEGQSAALIPIDAGDRITIINDEGGQHCEIIVADEAGMADAGIIGGRALATTHYYVTSNTGLDSRLTRCHEHVTAVT